jgi:hypothetical protein
MSDPIQKARSDAKLKNLPEERQDAIAEHARDHSLADTVAWLKDDGLNTSTRALSEFLSWYGLRRRFQVCEQNSLHLIELLKQKRPQMAESEREAWANEFFQMQAIDRNDPELYLAFASAKFKGELEKEKLRIKQETLDLSKAKFQRETCALFLTWWESKQARDVAASGATHSEKIDRLGQLMFGEDWKDSPNAQGRQP